MNPLVSIVIPNYNHARFLQERLNSIFNQTFQDFEVLIFDDASTDDSLQILENYKNHPKVSYFIVNKENSGSPFKQWKEGMRLAIGKYIWIAETDDYADNDFLKSQLEILKDNIAVVAKSKIVENLEQTEDTIFHPAFKNKDIVVLNAKMFLVSPIKNVSCVLFIKPQLKELEWMDFDKFSIMGDQFFYLEYFKNKTIIYNKNTVSYFRRISTSVSNFNSNKGLNYYSRYLDQHLAFGKRLLLDLEKGEVLNYFKRHFNKIKNRTTKKQKFSIKYFLMVLKFKLTQL